MSKEHLALEIKMSSLKFYLLLFSGHIAYVCMLQCLCAHMWVLHSIPVEIIREQLVRTVGVGERIGLQHGEESL